VRQCLFEFKGGHVVIGAAGRWLIGGATIQSLGEALYDLLIPLLVLQITGSPIVMAAVFVVGYAMEIIVGIIGGVIVDRVNRRKLLIGINAVRRHGRVRWA
jgi:MFS family permease